MGFVLLLSTWFGHEDIHGKYSTLVHCLAFSYFQGLVQHEYIHFLSLKYTSTINSQTVMLAVVSQ